MAEIDDVLDFIVGIGNVANNMANSQLQFAKADAAALEKEKLYERRLKEEEKNAMLDLNIEYLAAANKEVAQDIERIYSDGLKYGTTLNEHVEMHPDFKTEEMTALLKDYGLNLNEDLSVSMGIYDSQVKAIEANHARLKVGNHVQDILTNMISDFQDVEDMRRYIGTELDKEGIYNLADINKFLKDVSEGKYTPGLVTDTDILANESPDIIFDDGKSIPYANYDDLSDEGKAAWKNKFGDFQAGSGPRIDSEDIIEATFFQDKPWAEEYIQDQNFITGLNKVLSDELTIEAQLANKTKKELLNMYGFSSWEDEGLALTTGHKKIKAMDDLNDSKWGANGDKKLNDAMGIGMTGSDVYSFTAKEAENPEIVYDYKVTMAEQVVGGMNYLTENKFLGIDDDGMSKMSAVSPVLGKLVEKFKQASTPGQQQAIKVAMVRALYDELKITEGTPDNMKDVHFNVDLSKLKAFGFDLTAQAFGDWDGIPNDNTSKWDASSLSRFGKLWRRIEQVARINVGIGNRLDNSQNYYQSAGGVVTNQAEDKFQDILDTSSSLPNALPGNDQTAIQDSLNAILQAKDDDKNILDLIDQIQD
tara:strand:+ start:8858 stop:10627 length:1770 start_codon:yes stop_codon:yes gene_type:complete